MAWPTDTDYGPLRFQHACEQVRALRVNDTVTLNGTLFGIRDATYIHMFDHDRKTRCDMRGHAVIHTAPNVKQTARSEENPAGYASVCVGTTTSARMERFTRPLMEQYGVRITIGKGGLFAASQAAFSEIGGAYLAIIGGAAALETTWIEQIVVEIPRPGFRPAAGGNGQPWRQSLYRGQQRSA